MKSGKSHKYQYVLIGDYFFCLQQNPAVLAWILFFKRNDLIAIQPWLKKYFPQLNMNYVRYQWKIAKRNLITLIYFFLCRFGMRNPETVDLPVFGQFGMPVHKGYKVFNLRNGVVSKVFDPDVSTSSILSEIEQLRMVSQIDFAPTLLRWDIDERWYHEDYIRGNIAIAHRSDDSSTLLNAFYQEAVPCLKSLILFQPLSVKELSVYLEELVGFLEGNSLSRNKLTEQENQIFRNFVHSTAEQLKAEEDRAVHLVFSHGDFCPANLLSAKDGLRIVDWESIGYRSLLFDFYSYFFYRPVSPKLPVDKMALEINEALPYFISGLSLHTPHITEHLLASMKIYRQLYYIERLYMLVERDSSDSRLDMKSYIFRYIDAYSGCEEILNTSPITYHMTT
jgi:hypothetical protein